MPSVNLQDFNQQVASFNEKHGLNFSLENFVKQGSAFSLRGERSRFNNAFKSILTDLIKRSYQASIDGKTVAWSETIMNDLEENVLAPYREACKKNNVTAYPEAFGGMNEQEKLNFLLGIVEKEPKNQVDIIVNKYNNGEVTVDDMYAECLKVGNENATSSLKNVIKYAEALSAVRETRGMLWKIFHPFKNSAEKRELSFMKQLIATQDTVIVEALTREVKKEFSHISADQDYLQGSKNIIEKSIAWEKGYDKEFKQERERVLAATKEQMKKEQYVESHRPFFDFGYEPNVNTLEKDLAKIKNIDKAIEDGRIKEEDAIKFYTINKDHFMDVYNYSKTHSTKETETYIKETVKQWVDKVDEFLDVYFEYDPNEPLKNFGKEPLVVDLNEGKQFAVSPKIEASEQLYKDINLNK